MGKCEKVKSLWVGKGVEKVWDMEIEKGVNKGGGKV